MLDAPFTLGPVLATPAQNLIEGAKGRTRVEPKVMDVLCLLAARTGEVATRDVLIDEIWGIDHGGDESLTRAMSLLRKALRDAGAESSVIETIPKRGYRLTGPVALQKHAHAPTTAPAAPAAGLVRMPARSPQASYLFAAALILALGVTSLIGLRLQATPASPEPSFGGYYEDGIEQSGDLSLAVLPFANLSSDPEQEYFSDGLSEEFISRLVRIEGLRVTARASSFTFKGENADVINIGRTLGVAYLLDGSVRKDGDRLRVSAQLIDARSGDHLWSQSYDRRLEDVFDIQDEIAGAVAENLRITLNVGDAVRALGSTESVEAYELYLMAVAYIKLEGADNLERAASLLHQSVETDPNFADGWLALASVLRSYDYWRPDDAREAWRESNAAFETAMRIAPDYPAAHYMRAHLLVQQQDWSGALAAQSHARALAARHGASAGAHAISEQGPCVTAGIDFSTGLFSDRHLPCTDQARQKDPVSLQAAAMMQITLQTYGYEDRAEAEFLRSQNLVGVRGSPEYQAAIRSYRRGDIDEAQARLAVTRDNFPVNLPALDDIVRLMNDPEAARSALRRALVDPDNQAPMKLVVIADWLALFGDAEGAGEAMRRHFLDQGGTWYHLLWAPHQAETRTLPIFEEIVERLNMVAYWREAGRWPRFCRPLGETGFECS